MRCVLNTALSFSFVPRCASLSSRQADLIPENIAESAAAVAATYETSKNGPSKPAKESQQQKNMNMRVYVRGLLHRGVSAVPEALEALKGSGIRGDPYSLLIGMCEDDALHEHTALAVFEHMLDAGVTPERGLFACLLRLLQAGGNMRAAAAVLAKMSSVGVRPDIEAYNSVLRALAKSGEVAIALQLAAQAVTEHAQSGQADTTPNVGADALHELLSACVALQAKEEALQAVALLQQSGPPSPAPKPFSRNLALCGAHSFFLPQANPGSPYRRGKRT